MHNLQVGFWKQKFILINGSHIVAPHVPRVIRDRPHQDIERPLVPLSGNIKLPQWVLSYGRVSDSTNTLHFVRIKNALKVNVLKTYLASAITNRSRDTRSVATTIK